MALGHWLKDYIGPHSGGSGGGVGAEPLIVHIDGQETEGKVYADRTYQEVHDALVAGRTVLYSSEDLSIGVSFLSCIIAADFLSDGTNPHGFAAYYSAANSKFYTLHADSRDGYLYGRLSD